MKNWRRWDPRLEPKTPICEVHAFKRWIIEVVPDIFDPAHEKLMKRVLTKIARYERQTHGRFLLRTAHVARALEVFRKLRESERLNYIRHVPIPNNRVILAVYAETQDQLDSGVRALFEKRITPLDFIDTNPEEAIASALRDGVICEFTLNDAAKALAEGKESLREHLRSRMNYMRYCTGLGIDKIAIYVSPRSRMDFGAHLAPMKTTDEDEWERSHRKFDWVVCAGRIGPLSAPHCGQGPAPNDPHPIHHKWIEETMIAARDAGIPFCVPYLGEWAFTQNMQWKGDELVTSWNGDTRLAIDDIDTDSVDYDPSWNWGERGWGPGTPHIKPEKSYVQAIGSHLTGRAIAGRMFDEWPACFG